MDRKMEAKEKERVDIGLWLSGNYLYWDGGGYWMGDFKEKFQLIAFFNGPSKKRL